MDRIPGALVAARRIAQGTLTAEKLVAACLEHIAERDGALAAWRHVDPLQALDQARRIDRSATGGLLRGIPVAVKDNIDTGDLPTGYGSVLYDGFRPPRDAACVTLLRRAGGIVLGKTVCTEFAYFHPGPTVNPHDPARTPGGSSSGSAAAVAAGMVPLALGTQTAASIIRPASFCGCVGYKPSFGRLDRTGIRPLADSLDSLGILAADVADAAFLAAILSGRPLPDFTDRGLRPRIGICRTPWWHHAEPASHAALLAAANGLSAAGATVFDVALPPAFDGLVAAQSRIMAYEAARSCAAEIDTAPDRVSAALHGLVAEGERVAPETYDADQQAANDCRARFPDFLAAAGVDLLVAPSALGEAPIGLRNTGDPLFCRAWTLLGLPCVTVPGQPGPSGLPVGVQVVGAFRDDDRLLRAADWIAAVIKP
ncbi:MAG: amidase [Azospirillaceae bacterium]|nr:amidase [Azospirillaceae bacterium]